MAGLKYWVWLSMRKNLGSVTARRLTDALGGPEEIYFADEKELDALDWLKPGEKAVLCDKDMSAAGKALDDSVALGYRVMVISDAAYPERLRNIYDAPTVLYIRGSLPDMDSEAAVAIAGTRRCTPYGLKTAGDIGYVYSKAGGLVVSGLARGVDTAAARGALRAGGRVVGVIGSGPDVVYPPENRGLFEDIAAVGAIVSEYPPGTEAYGSHFPARNRILSGLSLGVVIIEAPERSGSLITAGLALEAGRDVFVVPGNVDAEACRGSNRLLREGAIPISDGWDVAQEYAFRFRDRLGKGLLDRKKPMHIPQEPEKTQPTSVKKEIDKKKTIEYIDLEELTRGMSETEAAVARAVAAGCRFTDEIIETAALPAAKVLSALTMLEIRGVVTRDSGKRFAIKSE